ncbi:arginine--tRNA ligase [Candidatus Micrarchaeota archaeon]|nr:arginine--tRNA ligase [Candidatus Micrarchaeota archaeon]
MSEELGPYSKARKVIAGAISASCKRLQYNVSPQLAEDSIQEAKAEFGDLASTIAFDLAKQLKQNPRVIAENIKSKIEKDKLIEKVEVIGVYLNFFLSSEYYELVLREILKSEEYGSGKKQKKKVLIEFPSVNPNKPWHVGHMRNAILGDSLSNVLEFYGYEIERENYIDDLGLQVAQSIWGYLHLSDRMDKKADHWLGGQYVEVAKRIEEEEVIKEVKSIVKELEEGDNEISKIGRELAEKCVLAQCETAYKLGIYQDVLVWESDIVRSKLLEKGLELLLESGAAIKETEGKNKGCIVAKLEQLEEFRDLESPDKVLVRSDGTATYTGKDISFQLWKFGIIKTELLFSSFCRQPSGKELFTTGRNGKKMKFGSADIVINVIGVEQKYPQAVINSLLKLMGKEKEAENSIHLAYEHAWLPEAKFSGRKGTWLGYTVDEVVEEAIERARQEIKNRFKDMSEQEKEKIALAVGIGALRFGFIRTVPEKKIVFKWEEALNFEGDSAPYIQYSYARTARILEKAGKVGKGDYRLLQTDDEKALIKLLAVFPEVIWKSSRDYRPHYIVDYLLDLAASFSKFYSSSPVLQADAELRNARLGLVMATGRVIRSGLTLLGIEAPARM